jgi:HK97 family phage prohead protease
MKIAYRIMRITKMPYSFYTDKTAYEIVESKSGRKNYFMTGYVSTGEQDLYNDIVSENCMTNMVEQLNNKTIKVDVDHEAYLDNTNIIPVGKIVEAKKDERGVWAKVQLNPYSPKFKDVWGSVKSGFIDAFSITYKAIKTIPKVIAGVKARILDEVELLNIALTGNPVNQGCKMMNVFTKSLNEMEENKMADEEKPEAKPEETPVEEKTEEAVTEETPVEEKTEETTEEAPAAEATEEAPAEETPAEAPAEPEAKALLAEIKSLRKDNVSMKAELKAIKEELHKELTEPKFKAIQEKPPEAPEEKLPSALGMIR